MVLSSSIRRSASSSILHPLTSEEEIVLLLFASRLDSVSVCILLRSHQTQSDEIIHKVNANTLIATNLMQHYRRDAGKFASRQNI